MSSWARRCCRQDHGLVGALLKFTTLSAMKDRCRCFGLEESIEPTCYSVHLEAGPAQEATRGAALPRLWPDTAAKSRSRKESRS